MEQRDLTVALDRLAYLGAECRHRIGQHDEMFSAAEPVAWGFVQSGWGVGHGTIQRRRPRSRGTGATARGAPCREARRGESAFALSVCGGGVPPSCCYASELLSRQGRFTSFLLHVLAHRQRTRQRRRLIALAPVVFTRWSICRAGTATAVSRPVRRVGPSWRYDVAPD